MWKVLCTYIVLSSWSIQEVWDGSGSNGTVWRMICLLMINWANSRMSAGRSLFGFDRDLITISVQELYVSTEIYCTKKSHNHEDECWGCNQCRFLWRTCRVVDSHLGHSKGWGDGVMKVPEVTNMLIYWWACSTAFYIRSGQPSDTPTWDVNVALTVLLSDGVWRARFSCLCWWPS